ncbi:hypothetical protein Q31b_09320 [Novipirellula aureliae]|uniref:SLA1 homology domain-containing protein n=1 Tax=Novipirellula aureliae TaxID=2527966 RepID=A0A5C6EDU9_9BACT|nr:hypothetical protein [Novipirellula aureliae]TWU45756.1 hypothetical protein Q31b_09320 [Novipirellula aureliae]
MSNPRIIFIRSLPSQRTPSIATIVWGFLFIFLSVALHASRAQAETWVGLRGNYQVEAELLGIWEDNAILLLGDGRRVSVELTNLRSDSRIQAQKLGNNKASQLQERIVQLKGQVEQANAPAPDPIPSPPAAPAYEPLGSGADAITALQHYETQAASGHALLAAYDSFPPKYRKDIDSLVKAAAEKMDPAAIPSNFAPLYSLGDFVLSHQNYLLSHPRVKSLDDSTESYFRDLLLASAGLLKTAFSPDTLDIESLRSEPFRDWLVARDAKLAPYWKQVAEVMQPVQPSYQLGAARSNSPYGYDEMDDDDMYEYEMDEPMDPDENSNQSGEAEPEGAKEMIVTRSLNENQQTATYQLVDGYWVEKELAENWATRMESLEKSISDQSGIMAMLNNSALSGLSLFVQPKIERLSTIESKAEFHQALDQQLTGVTSVGGILIPFLRSVPILKDWFPEASRSDRDRDFY